MLYILWASYLQLVYYPTIIIFLKELFGCYPFDFQRYDNFFKLPNLFKLFFLRLNTEYLSSPISFNLIYQRYIKFFKLPNFFGFFFVRKKSIY